jgi:hypothetical protein
VSRYRYNRPFPFWISAPVWLFLIMSGLIDAGVLLLFRLGLHPDPLASAVGIGLPLVPAGLFLLQDWRWRREDRER